MTTTLFAPTALLPDGWTRDVRLTIDGARIAAIEPGAAPGPGDHVLAGRALIPAMPNLHSHAFQRAMAGMTERRGPGDDSFWTWRTLMYRFLDLLTPDDVEAIAALVQVEMLESGYGSVAEFHYLHHQPGGTPYADPAELAHRIAAAAADTGIGLTLLPVLYSFGGAGEVPLAGGQRRFGNDLDGFLRLREAAGRHLAADAILGTAPHSLRATTPAQIAALAEALPDGPLHIHAAEQVQEVEAVEAWLGARPVAFLLDHVGIGPRWCLIHATQMTADETARLAGCGAVAGLCPITESNLGDGIFPGTAYLAAGGTIGIGSDFERAHRPRRGAPHPRVQPAPARPRPQPPRRPRRLGRRHPPRRRARRRRPRPRPRLRRAACGRARRPRGDRPQRRHPRPARRRPAPRRLDLRRRRPRGPRGLVRRPPRRPRRPPPRPRPRRRPLPADDVGPHGADVSAARGADADRVRRAASPRHGTLPA